MRNCRGPGLFTYNVFGSITEVEGELNCLFAPLALTRLPLVATLALEMGILEEKPQDLKRKLFVITFSEFSET
jgi:hypothetical protein